MKTFTPPQFVKSRGVGYLSLCHLGVFLLLYNKL